MRKLVTPGNVYMTSVEATYAAIDTLPHTIHVYNPRSGGGVNFAVTAKDGWGNIDNGQGFASATVTQITEDASGSLVEGPPQAFPNAVGQAVYAMQSSAAGWYRLHFNYEALHSGRTLSVRAYDDSGNALKLAWADPTGENVQLKAKFRVDQATPVFFKGGAFRNTLASNQAYVDNVKVDDKLLYRRAFDQGQFNYPLGHLPAGEHTLTCSFTRTVGRGKLWIGINETSFDLLGSKTAWDAAQFVYDGEMRTGDYDAWNEGIAFAQGATLRHGIRPPPVRRGNVFTMSLESPSLSGQSMNAILRIYPLGSGSETNWPTNRDAVADYAGGIYTTSGFSARYREFWRVSVPANAPIGRYVVRAIAPNGTQIGNDVLFYVIHNPFTLFEQGLVGLSDIPTNAYDENFDGMNMELDDEFDGDLDEMRDHFLAMYTGDPTHGYTLNAKLTAAFRRTKEETDYSMLDYAVAAAQGTTDEFMTARRLYRIVSQRFFYGGADTWSDASEYFVGSDDAENGFTPEHARIYSKPGVELPRARQTPAICYTTATVMASLARTCGLMSRMIVSARRLGGWSDHGFAEVFIPYLPRHDGKIGPRSATNSDTDHWYVFDATDPQGLAQDETFFSEYSEAVATRAQFGRAANVLETTSNEPFEVVTNGLGWNPLLPMDEVTWDVNDVSVAYASGPEFWLTASGVTGWIGRGEKDVYRISKSVTGAKAVRVRALPNDGEYLVPKLCVSSVANTPVFPDRCGDAATHYNLPTGESYVVVFNDAVERQSQRGDSVQYVLELEY